MIDYLNNIKIIKEYYSKELPDVAGDITEIYALSFPDKVECCSCYSKNCLYKIVIFSDESALVFHNFKDVWLESMN